MINRYIGNSGRAERLSPPPPPREARGFSPPPPREPPPPGRPGKQRQPAGNSGQGKAGGLLQGLFSKLDFSRLETEDLLLLLILYLLYRESGDEEMLIMMGAVLFL